MSKVEAQLHWGSESDLANIRRWSEKGKAAIRHHTSLLLDKADLRPGLSVLDLACGAGNPTLEVVKRVSPGGKVIGVDTSESLLSLGREYAQKERLVVEFRLADATALPFPDEHFDRVTSRIGAMYFAPLDRAIAEAHRVLRHEGHLAWSVWGARSVYFQATVGVAMKYAKITELPAETAQPYCFSMGGILKEALRNGGFGEVSEIQHQVLWSWPGPPEEASEVWCQGAPSYRGILDRLDTGSRKEAMSEITERFQRFYSAGEVNIPQNVIIATGVRR